MKIDDAAVEEFIGLWEKTYGQTLGKEAARKYIGQMLQLVDAVCRNREQ